MTVILIALIFIPVLLLLPPATIRVYSKLICANESGLKERKICFDLDKGRFVDPQLGRNSVYDVEVGLKHQEISLGQNRRKPRACRGYNFYRRCQKKYVMEPERLECRYARCSVCIADHQNPDCPLCFADKSAFCPAVETCSCPWKVGHGIWDSCRREINARCYESNRGRLSIYGFRATLNSGDAAGSIIVGDYIHRLGNWTIFDWAVCFQVTLITLYLLSAIAVGAIGVLNVWPMILLALLLFIPIFPVLCTNQHEDNLKLFAWMQLICGYVELFWASSVLLDMRYHPVDWRAYFAMFNVLWQFFSVILVASNCTVLRQSVNRLNNQRKQRNGDENDATDKSSAKSKSRRLQLSATELRLPKLRSVLQMEKHRLEKRKQRRKERMKQTKSEDDKFYKESTLDSRTQSQNSTEKMARLQELSDVSTARDSESSDFRTANGRNDKNMKSQEGELSSDCESADMFRKGNMIARRTQLFTGLRKGSEHQSLGHTDYPPADQPVGVCLDLAGGSDSKMVISPMFPKRFPAMPRYCPATAIPHRDEVSWSGFDCCWKWKSYTDYEGIRKYTKCLMASKCTISHQE